MSARLSITLERCIPNILAEWARRAQGSELEAISDEDRAGDLASVLGTMSAALGPPLPGSRAVDDFIEAAAAHGARRQAQGIDEACLFAEYDLLGAAVPHVLGTYQGAEGMLAPEDLVTLEGSMTTAILAGLRGFHRGEFERRGTWPEALARTVSEASELAPREDERSSRRSSGSS